MNEPTTEDKMFCDDIEDEMTNVNKTSMTSTFSIKSFVDTSSQWETEGPRGELRNSW